MQHHNQANAKRSEAVKPRISPSRKRAERRHKEAIYDNLFYNELPQNGLVLNLEPPDQNLYVNSNPQSVTPTIKVEKCPDQRIENGKNQDHRISPKKLGHPPPPAAYQDPSSPMSRYRNSVNIFERENNRMDLKVEDSKSESDTINPDLLSPLSITSFVGKLFK